MFEFCKFYGYLCLVKMNKEILYIYNCIFIRIIYLYVFEFRMKLYFYVKFIILFYSYIDNYVKYVLIILEILKRNRKEILMSYNKKRKMLRRRLVFFVMNLLFDLTGFL